MKIKKMVDSNEFYKTNPMGADFNFILNFMDE